MSTEPHPLDPHHDGSPCYVSHARPSLGDVVTLRVRVPRGADGTPGASEVVLRTVRDGEPAIGRAEKVAEDAAGAWWEVGLRIVNRVTSYRFLVSTGPSDFRWLTATGVHARDVTDGGDFLISTEHRLPAWVPDQVGYQVFPDRFGRTETGASVPDWAIPCEWDQPVVHKGPDVPFQWYGGTLDGVAEHLDHLDHLGATLLYLTPVFEAWSTHRYDAVSFDRVDPLLGGDEALGRLADAVHAHGLRLVGDLTTNHTGEHHDWFVRAQQDPTSPERSFYRFSDTEAHGYAAWLDIPSLPKLDHTSAELARRLYAGPDSIAAHWLRRGLDGWRVDVANMTGRMGADDLAHTVAEALRRTIDEVADDGWLLAEHGHDATSDLTGAGWHGTMDYAGFTRPVWCWLNGGAPGGPGLPHGLDYLGLPVDIPVLPGTAAVATMRDVHGSIPFTAWQGSTMHLDSHDTPRFRTVTGGGTDGGTDLDGRGRDLHLVGLGLQMTMPGVPVVFMGDELGLTAVDGEHARTPYPWDRRETWDEPTMDAYLAWIALRRAHVALRRGGLRWLHAGEDSMTFLREHPDQTVLVHAVRRGTDAVELPLHALGPDPTLTTLVGAAATTASSTLTLPGEAGVSVHEVG
ncbi:glycoside hydrolase family 13 protein [Nocardioides glacieisoli]|uniref:Glycoside hydrolase family 13 protein n=1 Tax=Nocardioides glacieisoli TaxID=1168730 RepID=A0A4Q2RKI3_9ACTN|nr:alpha-amylase family glycosyl hydrolase [Nocardioides glacieisoli]RYB89177.1 glycoside hydrolase family 13 protein [Nocardioides glacieisoli]